MIAWLWQTAAVSLVVALAAAAVVLVVAVIVGTRTMSDRAVDRFGGVGKAALFVAFVAGCIAAGCAILGLFGLALAAVGAILP